MASERRCPHRVGDLDILVVGGGTGVTGVAAIHKCADVDIIAQTQFVRVGLCLAGIEPVCIAVAVVVSDRTRYAIGAQNKTRTMDMICARYGTANMVGVVVADDEEIERGQTARQQLVEDDGAAVRVALKRYVASVDEDGHAAASAIARTEDKCRIALANINVDYRQLLSLRSGTPDKANA